MWGAILDLIIKVLPIFLPFLAKAAQGIIERIEWVQDNQRDFFIFYDQMGTRRKIPVAMKEEQRRLMREFLKVELEAKEAEIKRLKLKVMDMALAENNDLQNALKRP